MHAHDDDLAFIHDRVVYEASLHIQFLGREFGP
jgi:hypothetical protein